MARGPPEEITQLSFYFANFRNSDEAAAYVIEHDRGPGTFLLRPSTRSPGTLTLTISIDRSHARHVNVRQQPDSNCETGVIFFIIPERPFSSFHDLYAYYTANTICNLEQVSNVRLLNPLTRTDAFTPEPTHPHHQSNTSNFAPVVSRNEIPPLPRKSSVSGGDGGQPSQGAGERLSRNSFNQPGLPELPPIDRRPETSSLDSQGNEIHRTSGSSNGSGTIIPGRESFGVTGGVEYLAPRYPEPNAAIASHSPPASVGRGEGFSELHLNPRGQFSSEAALLPLSKKEMKEQKKLQKQEEKLRKKEEKKKKKGKSSAEEMNDLIKLGWCRPPMPVPDVKDIAEEHPYYSSPRPYKNHLEELKRMLKESEICDCGLRMLDAELVDGWTVHRSRDTATFMRVFYQHENGNTTWMFPNSIVDLLSVRQVQFIVRLCKEGSQDIPPCVQYRYEAIMATGPRHFSLPSPSSATSSRSRSGSDSSGWNPMSSAGLDQRPPMAGPGGM